MIEIHTYLNCNLHMLLIMSKHNVCMDIDEWNDWIEITSTTCARVVRETFVVQTKWIDIQWNASVRKKKKNAW